MLKCKNCKYLTESDKKDNVSLCKYESYWEVTDPEKPCKYLPEEKEPVCGDCARFHDPACSGCQEDEVPIWADDRLCTDFVYKNENNFYEVLSYWKSRGIYDRGKVNQLLDDFEKNYDELANQEKNGYQDDL